ncbi:MAG: amino acid synthesis family protein [Actinomycetes bacterium]|jgi:Amino acid synthesis
MNFRADVEMNYEVRSWYEFVHEINHEGGSKLDAPLLKAACAVIFKNPFAGRYVEDLSPLTLHSANIGNELGRRAVNLLGGQPVESYGKGGIAGINGEQEHVVACITTVFGNTFREQIGGGAAWISSATKVASAGTSLDIPLAYKDELYVRSHYDAMTIAIPDGPRPNELMICLTVSTGGRPHNRVGGITVQEVVNRSKL